MDENIDSDKKTVNDQEEETSNVHLDQHSIISTSSSDTLTNSNSDQENETSQHVQNSKWKKQHTETKKHIISDELQNNSNDDINHIHDRNLFTTTNENIASLYDDELRIIPPRRLPPIPEDKFHRRNPQKVRQELQMLEDIMPETTLADVQLTEMPGLQNKEQWKRIAGRTAHSSPPLPRQYYQTVMPAIELQNLEVPQALGSYRRPGRSGNEDVSITQPSPWRTNRRRIIVGSSVVVVILVVVIAVIVGVTLVRRTDSTTEYYSGNAVVVAKFNPVLFDPTSTLARSYKREFCALITTTIVDARSRYATSYSSCTVVRFRNGSIITDFILGFTRSQNVTRLSSYLNRTLYGRKLYTGTVSAIVLTQNATSTSNTTNDLKDVDVDDYEYDDDDDLDYEDYNYNNNWIQSPKHMMSERNSTDEQQTPVRTSHTTVTYTTHDKGLSITISETITITNNHFDKSPINNKKYELVLVPSIENTKTVVLPIGEIRENNLLSPTQAQLPAPTSITTNAITNVISSPSSQTNLLKPIKPNDTNNFAYIDETSEDCSFSSEDVTSTLEDLTARDSTTTLNDETMTNSITNQNNDDENHDDNNNNDNNNIETNRTSLENIKESSTQIPSTHRLTTKLRKDDKFAYPTRQHFNYAKRSRRMMLSKNHRRLLQYELIPTGKVYYIDRPLHNNDQHDHTDKDDNSSIKQSTILSRSSSVDTLSDKRHRQNKQNYHGLSLKRNEQKLSIGGRLASINNISTSSPFKPIESNKNKRFSSFEPTQESLDKVFDTLIAADKRREEQEFWKEKFDPRTLNTRPPIINGRKYDTTNLNTMPFLRTKQSQFTPNLNLNPTTNKHTSFYENRPPPTGCIYEDCLQRRTLVFPQPERNYSPNTIYSTNYPKQQLSSNGKTAFSPTASSNQPTSRILPLTHGRIGRAPQAQQTSDELSTASDVWAIRLPDRDELQHVRKSSNHTRFQSAMHRNRPNEQKPLNDKRASSVGQQKSTRTQKQNASSLSTTTTTTKSKFFDLFKFNR